jgi:uncharacterized protein (DUF486 family)
LHREIHRVVVESELNAQDSQVPANRIGAQTFTVIQLKIMQECITLVVFTVIAYLLFGQSIRWNHVFPTCCWWELYILHLRFSGRSINS